MIDNKQNERKFCYRLVFILILLVALCFIVFFIWQNLYKKSYNLESDGNSGSVIRIANGSEPATLDPQRIRSEPELHIARNLFEGLVQQTDLGNVEPAQAEYWTVSDSGLVYTFYLRPNIKWSNNDPVTAGDFVYAWRRAVSPEFASPYAWYFETMGVQNASSIIKGEKSTNSLGVVALDDSTLQVTLERPVPYFLASLAHVTTMPVHAKTVENLPDTWTLPHNIVSNGAYTLDSWVVNEKIILNKNDIYWGQKDVALEQAIFFPLQPHAAYRRYRSNEIDMMLSNVPFEVARSLNEAQQQELVISPQLGLYYYTFNLKHKALQDKRVRQALSNVIDRDLLVNSVLSGYELPRIEWVPEGILDYQSLDIIYDNKSQLIQEQRIKQAQQLMREAGFDKDNPLKLDLLYSTSDSLKKIALAVGAMWKQYLGVELTLNHHEWKVFLDTRAQGEFDILSSSWLVDVNDPSAMLEAMRSNHPNNLGAYYSQQYDDYLDKAQNTLSLSKRVDYYQQAELLILNDIAVLPLYQYVNLALIKSDIHGYPESNPQGIFYLKKLTKSS